MTLDDAASQRQHASDLGDYESIDDLKSQMLAALRAQAFDRALNVFTDLTRIAVLAEREACARLAEQGECPDSIAAAIRARR